MKAHSCTGKVALLHVITVVVVVLSLTLTVCQCHAHDSTANQLIFPDINYHTQSPYHGTHQVSISHKDIDEKAFAEKGIEIHDFLIGSISRRIVSRSSFSSSTSIQRDLGDFDDLNKLLKGVTISLPDINRLFAGRYLLSDLYIWLRNMVCTDISLGDIIITHGLKNDQEYDFSLYIEDLAISCDLDWRYEYSFFRGEGSAQVETTKSDASVELRFKSIDFDLHPPKSVESTDCATAIEIDNLDLRGGVVASIASLFEGAIINAIEGSINDVACEELESLGEDFLSDAVTQVGDFLETLLPENTPPVDYLFPEKNLTVPEGVELLDYSTLGSESGNWFEVLINFIDDVLGPSTDGTDFNINALLRSLVLNEDRILDVPLSVVVFDGHDMLTETIITMTSLRIDGLDTFNRFDSLERAGNQTLFNHFSLEHIDVEVDFDLVIKPSSRDDSIIGGPGEVVEERMTVSTGIDELDVDFHLLLAVDKDKIGALPLGSLYNASNILPCILEPMHHVEVAGFGVYATAIDIPTLSDFISPGIDRVVSSASDAILGMYEPILVKVLPNIFQIAVKEVLNDLIQESFSSIDVTCPIITNFPTNKTYVNFADLLLSEEESVAVGGTGTSKYGHLIRDVIVLVKDELLKFEEDGRSILNEMLISTLTEKQSGTPGTIAISDELGVEMSLELGEFVADLEFKISNTTINNIDSIGEPMSVLEPVAPQVLNNTVGIGVGPDPLQASTILTIGLADGSDVNLRNVVELSVDARGVVDAAAQLSVVENAFMNFPIEDMLNYHCWLSLMPAPLLDSKGVRLPQSKTTLSLEDLVLAMSTLNLNINCIDCSSPLLQELAPLLSSDEAVGEITDLMNDVLDYLTNLLGGTFLQVQIDRLLAQAPLKCPHSLSYVDDNDNLDNVYDNFPYQKQPADSLTLLFIVLEIVVGVIAVSAISYFIVQIVKRRRQSYFMKGLSEEAITSLAMKQQRNMNVENRLNVETKAMFRSQSIPIFVRILVPLVVLANIGFFLSGHLSLGASVDLDVLVAGEKIRIPELFVFSMAESVMDMWEAGAKELAIMILIFSGLWPYTKQLAVLVLWFTPPSMISVRTREFIFIWLDRLGKWSFVDIFVLILSLSSFRVSVNTPDDLSYLPKEFFVLNLLVTPCNGLYSNMVAQLISQVNSHYIIHYHRKIKFDHEKRVKIEKPLQEEETDMIAPPLYKHMFKDTFSKRTLYLRPIASKVLTFLSVLFVGVIIAGCAIPSYSLEQFGIIGLVSSKPFVAHDIFSTMKLLWDQASFTGTLSDRIGLSVLASILILTVLLVPIAQLALSLYRWFQPMSKKRRLRVFVAIEALAAWQYLEVYLLSIVVASWQLGGVSEFLINDYCGGLEETFATLQYYGILGVNEAQCFRVSARLEPATWFLIASSILLALVSHIINSAAAQQEEDLKIDFRGTSSSYNSSTSSFEVMRDDVGGGGGGNVVVDDVLPLQETRFHKLHLLEPITFRDCYPFFLQKNAIESMSRSTRSNTIPLSPTTTIPAASPEGGDISVELDVDVTPVPYYG